MALRRALLEIARSQQKRERENSCVGRLDTRDYPLSERIPKSFVICQAPLHSDAVLK